MGFKEQIAALKADNEALEKQVRAKSDVPHDWRAAMDKARQEVPGWAKAELEQLRAKGRKFEDDQRAAGRWNLLTHIAVLVIGMGLGYVLSWL